MLLLDKFLQGIAFFLVISLFDLLCYERIVLLDGNSDNAAVTLDAGLLDVGIII